MYRFVRPLLFYFDPEIVHEFVIGLCRVTEKAPFAGRILARLSEFNDSRLHVVIGNLRFPNSSGTGIWRTGGGDGHADCAAGQSETKIISLERGQGHYQSDGIQ